MSENQEIKQTDIDEIPSSVSSQVVNVTYEKSEKNDTWFWGIGILLIVFLLLLVLGMQQIQYPTGVISVPQNIGSISQGVTSNGVQTHVVADQLYITNGQTKMVSVVDSKTNQLKTMIPFG